MKDMFDSAGIDTGFRLVGQSTETRPFVEPDTRSDEERDRAAGQGRLFQERPRFWFVVIVNLLCDTGSGDDQCFFELEAQDAAEAERLAGMKLPGFDPDEDMTVEVFGPYLKP
jgi:hypothetical protein